MVFAVVFAVVSAVVLAVVLATLVDTAVVGAAVVGSVVTGTVVDTGVVTVPATVVDDAVDGVVEVAADTVLVGSTTWAAAASVETLDAGSSGLCVFIIAATDPALSTPPSESASAILVFIVVPSVEIRQRHDAARRSVGPPWGARAQMALTACITACQRAGSLAYGT